MHCVAQHRRAAEVEGARHAFHLVRKLTSACGEVAQGASRLGAALVATAAKQKPL